MKKTVLFCCLVSTLLTSNVFTANQQEETFNVREEQNSGIGDKVNRFSRIAPYKKKIAQEELIQYLKDNFPNISNVQDKISISGLLRELKESSSQNIPDNIEKLTIKNTLLNTVIRLTSPTAIACATIIVFLLQIRGIISSKELIGLLESINSTIKWHTVGNIGGVVINLVPTFLLKILG